MPAAVHQREFWLKLREGGGSRFARSWWPATQPQAIMCIVPGLGDHSGRYAPLAMQLVTRGIGVLSMDLQGHGLSPGRRGCIDSYPKFLSEVANLVQWARGGDELSQRVADDSNRDDHPISLDHWPDDDRLQVCLYGHSMGGNLVLNSVLHGLAKPDRLIASAPMLRAVHPPGPMFMRIARILKIIAPNWRLKAPVRKEFLSHLNSEQEAYQHDPLMHRRVSLRLGASLIDSGLWAIEQAAQLNVPTLLLHGSEDRITDPLASVEFTRTAMGGGAPTQLITYNGMLHDLHRDQGRERVIADIANWALGN
ncbi:MAG: lysophospholipase [Pirellulaceae bacterium]|nr:lysophospholipase [Pirellulaceae bacterium]